MTDGARGALRDDLLRVAALLADAARPEALRHFRAGTEALDKGPCLGLPMICSPRFSAYCGLMRATLF